MLYHMNDNLRNTIFQIFVSVPLKSSSLLKCEQKTGFINISKGIKKEFRAIQAFSKSKLLHLRYLNVLKISTNLDFLFIFNNKVAFKDITYFESNITTNLATDITRKFLVSLIQHYTDYCQKASFLLGLPDYLLNPDWFQPKVQPKGCLCEDRIFFSKYFCSIFILRLRVYHKYQDVLSRDLGKYYYKNIKHPLDEYFSTEYFTCLLKSTLC